MTERITNFHDAHKLGAYPLARRWADSTPLPRPPQNADAELEELAVMAALRDWLTAWLPISIHRSLLAGASVYQLVAAMGTDAATIAKTWREWDAGQRKLWQTYPDMDHTAEHDRVAEILRTQAPDIQMQPACEHRGAVDIVSLLGPADSRQGVPTNDGREMGASEGTCPDCGARVVTVNIYDPAEPWTAEQGHGSTDQHTNWTPWLTEGGAVVDGTGGR